MYKLDQEKQISANKDNIGQILKEYSIFDFTFAPINEGIANISLVIKTSSNKYVLRIYAQDRNTDDGILHELSFQDYLRENGIPIPLIYKNTEGKELTIVEMEGKRWQAFLMEFIEGQSVTPEPSLELITELAKLQAKMHLLGVEFVEKTDRPKHKWKDLHDSLAEKIQSVPVPTKEIFEFIDRVKSYTYSLSPELAHGYNHIDIDFYGNVITKENKIKAIIDFDDLQYSPIVSCLGITLWGILNDSGLDSMKKYLEEYEKIRPLTPLERSTLPHVVFFRNYVIGIIDILRWEKEEDSKEIEKILQMEKDIPTLFAG